MGVCAKGILDGALIGTVEWGGADAIVKEAVNRRTPYGSCWCDNCEASRSYDDGERAKRFVG